MFGLLTMGIRGRRRHCTHSIVFTVAAGIWTVLCCIIVFATQTNVRRPQRHANVSVSSDGHSQPCPTPYGANIDDNIRRILRNQRDAEPASRVYLRHLGLPWQGGAFVNLSTTAGSTFDVGSSRPTGIQPTVVLAASANHYQELQALLHNIHNVVNRDGRLKVVLYDLGLGPFQLNQVHRHCKCEVHPFPFHEFPTHVRDLAVYSWKPILVQLALKQWNFIMYMDASIRILTSDLQELFDVAWKRGILVSDTEHESFKMVEHTDPRTFAFLGEKPCYFENIPEKQAGFLLLRQSRLLQLSIIRPWVECTLSLECIAPQGSKINWFCSYYRHFFGECHRFDQSALNIVISRIFHHTRKVPLIPSTFFKIDRNHRMNYFETM
ncbi:uncharacterized protein LOC124290520 isoform X2 [Haliotis rubra]|uniref:uncharacterized protein LOC124290520 isoform X2 n=1 Tax=Haliotis rubra TaxID=36100 RepID=UPI001EE5E6C3|nr:uncharacterized protein LOC124290520 isoform X2 [Haliotis rubra]